MLSGMVFLLFLHILKRLELAGLITAHYIQSAETKKLE